MRDIAPANIKPQLFYARTVHDRIESQITDATQALGEGQSLLVEVLLNDGRVIQPTQFGFHNPNFVVVYGTDANGNEVTVLVSHTNIQIVLTVLNKPSERKPIGFQKQTGETELE